MSRQMADPAFHADQTARAFTAPHIAPINAFVDSIRDRDGRGWVPYVPPHHGGIDARVISILRDPGPATQLGVGSGFISVENDDPTAERMAHLFDRYGIPVRTVLPRNAYPWYIDAAPSARQSKAGAGVLVELLELTPEVEVVLLQGRDAEKAWRRTVSLQPHLADRFSIHATIHPGRQALFHPDPEERRRRVAHQERAFEEVSEQLAR
ncbi:uracil-DNA glycosylase [Frigoribacterium sp. MCBA15_019]|uniref:uracil-DNA glycosylase n=1 Tax=Frigoribacterium sp. MCBA15_019 TaxID=1898745 RepID=UPI0008DCB089|nr:uracil-DNA glycosylase [Frigoribacterium sp. MCBA15_019]OII26000.1 hypothetical protein BIV04_13720 [Frigoribacterium sp. MCBA15_019]